MQETGNAGAAGAGVGAGVIADAPPESLTHTGLFGGPVVAGPIGSGDRLGASSSQTRATLGEAETVRVKGVRGRTEHSPGSWSRLQPPAAWRRPFELLPRQATRLRMIPRQCVAPAGRRSHAHALQNIPFQDLDAAQAMQPDDRLGAQFRQDPRHGLDGETEIVANVLARHRQFDPAQAALPFGHVEQKRTNPFDRVLATEHEQMLLRPRHAAQRMRQQLA
uniref:Uncharacterized protein n=1 Tax=uncultured bacterium 1042 TaxID=548897 RepID=B8R8T3_9BACT|nr:hypothetical protein [uncultured bacterium 1042]